MRAREKPARARRSPALAGKNSCPRCPGASPYDEEPHLLSRKQTAWRKSRKFGDVKGRRTEPKIADGILARAHALSRPGPLDKLPIIIFENPSKNFFFPIDPDDVLARLRRQPRAHVKGITLRKYYLESLLLHELGHHCDNSARTRNPAQSRQA